VNTNIESCYYHFVLSRDVVSRRSFQTSRSRGNVGRSWSWSRLGLKIKCLCLITIGLVYKSICTAFCFTAKLHVHRFECKVSILVTDSQVYFIIAMQVQEAEWPVLFYINSFYFNVAIHCFGTKLKVEGLQKRLGLARSLCCLWPKTECLGLVSLGVVCIPDAQRQMCVVEC